MQLTLTEYQAGYSRVLKSFAATQTTAWQEELYKVRRGYSRQKAQALFLFCYALSTWEHDDSATNYLTEDQVQCIITKANQLS